MKILLIIQLAFGYGRIGHSLSGQIAQQLLSPAGQALVESLLSDFDAKLSKAATWADEIKSNHKYDWAKKLHYLNPVNDNPPTICVYHPGPEDCPNDGCVVSAIHNYTNLLLDKTYGGKTEALLFLIHFIGDLHQPLHATGRQRGGTQALVKFNGRITNLHSVWDSMMFEQRVKRDFQGSHDAYTQFIIKQIGTAWRGEIAEWLSCPSPGSDILSLQRAEDPLAIKEISGIFLLNQDYATLICPEKWAAFSNMVNCKNVWPGYKRKYELSATYYQENILVEEKMLAQAAIRMAAIIDFIAVSLSNSYH